MAQRVASGSQGRMNRRFLMVALLLGALSAVLVWAKLSSSDSSTSSSAAVGNTQVVVARVPILQNTSIVPDMLEVKSISANSRVAGSYGSVSDVVGKVTKFPVETGQQLVTSGVVDIDKPAAGTGLSYVIPTGKRAMSFTTSQVAQAGGLILPGDYVDVIWLCCDKPVISKTILRNIQVAAIAQTIINSGPVASSAKTPASGDAGGASGSTNPVAAGVAKPEPDAVTATLLLTPEETQQLFLAESNGKLRLELRGVGDQDLKDPPVVLLPQLIPLDQLQSLPDALKPDAFKR